MAQARMKQAKVLKKFKDAGNEEVFDVGPDLIELEEGRFRNFKVAGLVREATAEEAKAAAAAAKGKADSSAT
ncbi:MAG TPA: hypothetical protein VF503_20620 [Sphingobium sp.]|uniref:hypothetical protein n=1 Tax=Sphingobium sp. TaxID=1912891 RepID=UPI002ED69082